MTQSNSLQKPKIKSAKIEIYDKLANTIFTTILNTNDKHVNFYNRVIDELKRKGYNLPTYFEYDLFKIKVLGVKVLLNDEIDVTDIIFEVIKLGFGPALKIEFMCSLDCVGMDYSEKKKGDVVEFSINNINIVLQEEYPQHIFEKFVKPVLELSSVIDMLKTDRKFAIKAIKSIVDSSKDKRYNVKGVF
ncbi:hypothetical protein [Caldicellulosiruptor morganii]|uniref:Uncharacterized protein n=1 Tax=Caldicellulosiruptor morganii TaxID=1387555 RepID=A0ABY7BM40_9FIRM|nr:hypothetical protein [Caldicellulosiruptor morganii]WAM33912.1 hypothetical protein OTK00_000052 [Caldicellulosiruptor morganii]